MAGQVGPGTLLWLTALWPTGLRTYTRVLTGSLPGLRNTGAFILNAAGSAISNVLPFGGAAGVAVTTAGETPLGAVVWLSRSARRARSG